VTYKFDLPQEEYTEALSDICVAFKFQCVEPSCIKPTEQGSRSKPEGRPRVDHRQER